MPPTFWTWLDSILATRLDAWIAGGLAGLAACALVVALVGRADTSRPRCRSCNGDARPHAWTEDRRCACGNDLGAPGSVRCGRRRRRRPLVVAAALALATAAIVALGVGRLVQGGTWLDYLPARWLVAAADDAGSVGAISTLIRRFGEGMDADVARTLLRDLLDAPLATHDDPARRSFLVDACLAAALREPGTPDDLAERALVWSVDNALVVSTTAMRLSPTLPEIPRTRVGFPVTALRDRAILIRIDEATANGNPVTIPSVPTNPGRNDETWLAVWNDSNAEYLDLAIALPQMTDLTLRVTIAYVPLPFAVARSFVANRDPQRFVDARAALDAIGATVVTATVTTTVGSQAWPPIGIALAAPWGPFAPLYDRGERAAHASAHFVASVAGGVVAGCAATLSLVLAWRLGRGGLSLARPTCRRCSSALHAVSGAAPDRCPECGQSLALDVATRHAVRRGSIGRFVVVGSAASAFGVLGAAFAGAWVARRAELPLVRFLSDPEAEARGTLAALFSNDPLEAAYAARDLGGTASWNTVPRLPRYPLETMNDALRIVAKELVVAASDPSARPPRDTVAREALAEHIRTLESRGMLSGDDRWRVTEAFLEPPSTVSLPRWCAPGEPFTVRVGAGDSFTTLGVEEPADATNTAAELGVTPFWRVGNVVTIRGVPTPSAPGLQWVPLRWTYLGAEAGTNAPPVSELRMDASLIATRGCSPRTILAPVVVTDASGQARLSDEDLRALDPSTRLMRDMRLFTRRVGTHTLVLPYRYALPPESLPPGTSLVLELQDGDARIPLGGPTLVARDLGIAPLHIRTRVGSTGSPLYIANDPATRGLLSIPPVNHTFERVGRFVDEDGVAYDEYRCNAER